MDGVHIDESWPVWKQFYTAYYPLLRDMCAVFLVCLVLFGVVFNIHTVSGSSMEPTFDSGTIIIGNHIAPDLERGNIVVCKPSNYDKIIIKRIIGVPGDVIDIDYENGVVYRNGVALEEDYVKAPTRADLGLNSQLLLRMTAILLWEITATTAWTAVIRRLASSIGMKSSAPIYSRYLDKSLRELSFCQPRNRLAFFMLTLPQFIS